MLISTQTKEVDGVDRSNQTSADGTNDPLYILCQATKTEIKRVEKTNMVLDEAYMEETNEYEVKGFAKTNSKWLRKKPIKFYFFNNIICQLSETNFPFT